MKIHKPHRSTPSLQGLSDNSAEPKAAQRIRHRISNERISTGIDLLDGMLGGKGLFRGSSTLVSGPPGAGKSSFAAHFTNVTCQRGERVLYFTFDETKEQLKRDMLSIRIDLQPWLEKDLLQIYAMRPWAYGQEQHLNHMVELVGEFKPEVVIVDPVCSLLGFKVEWEVKGMLASLVDQLKSKGVTVYMTSLANDRNAPELAGILIFDLIDTWLQLRDVESNGERNRLLTVIKSRGCAHSNQMREYLITDRGVELVEVYVGPGQVLTGSARLEQEAEDKTARQIRKQEIEQMQASIERKRRLMEAKVAALEAEFESEEAELKNIMTKELAISEYLENTSFEMDLNRKVGNYW